MLPRVCLHVCACVDMGNSNGGWCVHVSHGGMPCVGVGVGHSGLIWQDTGRVYTHVSEGTACVCVCVRLDTGWM